MTTAPVLDRDVTDKVLAWLAPRADTGGGSTTLAVIDGDGSLVRGGELEKPLRAIAVAAGDF